MTEKPNKAPARRTRGAAKRAAFRMGKVEVPAGGRATIDLPISMLSNHTPMTLPVHVAHGREDGPVFFVSAAIHGDEIIGVEIIRRLLRAPALKRLRGTLLAIPIVNAFGFLNHSRYLPDRRDLNRSFPGSPRGSLTARLAHLFLTEIVERADYGIDLHSAAVHRCNLPQIRVSSRTPEFKAMAEAFGAPVIIHSETRDGSLRQVALERGIKVLVYEAGEGLRFDEFAIRAGVRGILRVMGHLGMTPSGRSPHHPVKPVWSLGSQWLRAPQGGLFRAFRKIGDSVAKGDLIGMVSDPFGEHEEPIIAAEAGLIIGRSNLPVINHGDALFHIAKVAKADVAEKRVEAVEEFLAADQLFDEDEII